MDQKNFVERRKHRRYIVSGRVNFTFDSLDLWGELVNFGHGGMLIRTHAEVMPEDARLEFQVVANCYPEMFTVPGQVVGVGSSLLSIKFLERTRGAKELLLWLEGENFPWTGGNFPAIKDPVRPARDPSPQQFVNEAEMNAPLNCIFQDA